MPNHRICCTIDVDGQPRELFTVEDRERDGDAYIYFTHGEQSLNGLPPVKSMKISLHRSQDSPDSNLIKLTRRYTTGVTDEIANLTRAVKAQNLWAPFLYSKRPNLSNPRYLATDVGDDHLSLGKYNPKHFTLFFALLASAPNTPYQAGDEEPFNSQSIELQHFTLTVLWTFAYVFSNGNGETQFLMTIHPEDLREDMRDIFEGLRNGHTAGEIATAIPRMFHSQLSEHVASIAQHSPLSDLQAHLTRAVGLFRDGDNISSARTARNLLMDDFVDARHRTSR